MLSTRKLILSATAASLFGLSQTAAAESWGMLPIMGEDYDAQATLSIIGGQVSPDAQGAESGSAQGVEMSFACPLIAAPDAGIRQQFSITQYDEQGLELQSIEINPHYLIDMGKGLQLGFGPGIGYTTTTVATQEESVWGMQLGASVHYRPSKRLFLGADVRQQFAGEANLGGSDIETDNSRVSFKVGVNF